MLVLSRKVDEQIIIDSNIRVTVVSIRGNQVRLGFEAPPRIPILREELRRSGSGNDTDRDHAGGIQEAADSPAVLMASGER